MNDDIIKALDIKSFQEQSTQSQVSVPRWFLEKISSASSVKEVEDVITLLRDSEYEDLCKRKSINLARARIRIILNLGEKLI